jgi:hypothetical protein
MTTALLETKSSKQIAHRKPHLHREGELVVVSAQEVSHLTRSLQVWTARQAHAEGVQPIAT